VSYRTFLAAFIAAALPSVVSHAGALVSARSDLVFVDAVIKRQDIGGGADYFSQPVYNGGDNFNGVLPDVHGISANGSGNIHDTASGTELVLSGQGAASVTSTLAYDGLAQLTSYSLSGQYSASVTTGTLAGYAPVGTPENTEVAFEASPGYNSGISIIVSGAPAEFSMTVAQTNSTGTAFNAGEIYLDFNNDGNFNNADGDIQIVPYFAIGGNATDTRTGTLEPSTSPYRIFFFGNSFESTTSDDAVISDSADFTSSFTIVPEPSSVAAAFSGITAMGAMRRRRRRPG
jgi:hypothetical protein